MSTAWLKCGVRKVGGAYGIGDGQFKDPFGIAVDGSGRVYVVDVNNNRVQVFSLTPTETVTP